MWASGIDDIPLVNNWLISYQHRNKSFFQKNQRMGWISGTAFVIKREVFASIGGFDSDIFMYGEDVELCMRLHSAHHHIDYFSAPSLTHLGQASSSSKTSLQGEFLGLRYLITKHFNGFNKTLCLFIVRFAALLRMIIFGIVGDRKRKKIYAEIYSLV
jgi:GT2 family glycosyltransferase